MRILILSQGLPFPVFRDGLTVRVYHLLREFSQRAECHLIAGADHGLAQADVELLREMSTFDLVDYKEGRGVVAIAKKICSNRRYYSREFENKTLEAIRAFKPDVVFAEQTFMAQYARVLRGVPKVMSAVDAISLAAYRQAKIGNSPVKALAWRYVARQRMAFEKKWFPQFDRVTVVAQEDADFLERRLGRKIDVVPNGVDTELFRPSGLTVERKAVVFTGNLSAPMNEEACLYLLQSVFPIIHRHHPNLCMAIIGREPTRRIREAIPPYVNLRADVEDMQLAMRDALLSLSPIVYGTGIKNNVLQAMAMGIPVVATPLIADPIGMRSGETGFVAERGPAYLRAVEGALADRGALERIGRASRTHIDSSLSWRHAATTYLDMFEELVTQDTAHGSSSEA